MSKWARKRKRNILIIIASLIFIVLVFSFFSFKNKKPTCFDATQNGKETGIDCGGACQKVCRDEVRNIVVWWERPFKVAHGVYNVVAYFENQNLDSGIEEVFYEFRLYDKNNVLVSEPRLGSTFIEANKRSAVFESGITTGDSDAYTAFFKISSKQDWEKIDQSFSYNLFQVGEPILSSQDTTPKLSAPIENKTFFNFTDTPVVAILYNAEDNAIAASRTFIDSIEQGEKKDVYFSWPEPFGDTVSRVEIIPRVNPFISLESITR